MLMEMKLELINITQVSVSCFVETKKIDDMQLHYIEVINNLNQILNNSRRLELTSPRNN